MSSAFYDGLFATFAFILGAVVGSFLNVCIYRMPRDLSVNNPRRSFCPLCNYQIPWWRNIPLLSWLMLRGRCANCSAAIPFRYFGVELLTALLFLAVWWKVWPDAWALALPYWILVSLFVVATFIDFEHFIIPDEITWGGVAAGIVLSLGIPTLHGTSSHLWGAIWALVGAATGFGLLWAVVELGKLAFGKKHLAFDQPQRLQWKRKGEDADLLLGDEELLWSDFFVRGNEQLQMDCEWIEIEGERFEGASARWSLDWLFIGDQKWELLKLDSVVGAVTEVTLPREAMGFGDVKFLACIGAFLGWKAALFTVMAASMIGAVVGILAITLRRRDWSGKIPFGPYLAFGALVWLFTGPELVRWYLEFAAGPAR